MAGPSTSSDNAEPLTFTPGSKASAETDPDSTVTKARKESQSVRKDFRNSLAQLTQVQSRLGRQNNEHVKRADAIMRDMYEMRKGLFEIQAEGRQNQERLEASMASLNDIIKQRENVADILMSEMSAVMKERDRQADKRLKLVSVTMQRRNADANTSAVDLMTTMEDLTLGVKAIVSLTAAAQKQVTPAPPAFNQANMPSTSTAPPHTQTTYRRIAQPSVEHTRPPKLIPTATYKRDLTKASKMARVMRPESRDAETDPMTDISIFDPFARAASTTGDYCLRQAV